MATFGAHAFVWGAEWTAEGAERALRGAAARGLDFVEIPLLRDLDAFPLERTLELLDETGVEVTTSLGLPPELHMPFDPEGALGYLEGAIDLTRRLGSDTPTGGLYTHLGTLPRKPPTEGEIAVCAAALKRAAQVAA